MRKYTVLFIVIFCFLGCNARNKFLILDDGFKSQCGIYFHEKIEKQNFV